MITQKAFNFLKNVWSLQFNKLASRKINIKKINPQLALDMKICQVFLNALIKK